MGSRRQDANTPRGYLVKNAKLRAGLKQHVPSDYRIKRTTWQARMRRPVRPDRQNQNAIIEGFFFASRGVFLLIVAVLLRACSWCCFSR